VNYAEVEEKLIAYYCASGAGCWPDRGNPFEPSSGGGVSDPEATLARIMDSTDQRALRKTHREVGAVLARLHEYDRTVLARAYTPRSLGTGAMQTVLMTGDDGVLNPKLRPLANLAPLTRAASDAYCAWRKAQGEPRDQEALTLVEVVRWLDDEARGLRAPVVFLPIREEADSMTLAALAAFDHHWRVRAKGGGATSADAFDRALRGE